MALLYCTLTCNWTGCSLFLCH